MSESKPHQKTTDSETTDLSDAHYRLLSNTFEHLSKNIQIEIQQNLLQEREARLSRYNQNLLMALPKHLLVKAGRKFKRLLIDIDVNQRFQVYDSKAKQNFIYTTRSEVILNAFTISHANISLNKLEVSMKLDYGRTLNGTAFDLWLNPALWEKLNFRLLLIKNLMFEKKNLQVKLSYNNGKDHLCMAHLENIEYTLAPNDNMRLMLVSPEFQLGFKVVLDQIPVVDDSLYIVGMTCLFEMTLPNQEQFLELLQYKDRLFESNIIPLFNLYEGYSSTQRLDDKYDQIPLLNAEDPDAKPCYVKQIWVNNRLYKKYYHHIQSEYVFHKHTGKLSFYPKNLKQEIQKNKKIFANITWMQSSQHGRLLKITSNAIAISDGHFELITVKPEVKINDFQSTDQAIQIFRAFSDLDIRKQYGFLTALGFLCSEEHKHVYQQFKNEVSKISYDELCNSLKIIVKNQSHTAFVTYVADVVAQFFYINSPQVIAIKTIVETH